MSIYSRSPSPIREEEEDGVEGKGGDEEDGRRSRGSENQDGDRQGSDSEAEEEKKKDDKKAKKPRGPVKRQMINEDMLTGINGLGKLQESFKDFEFKGKGKEKEDLGRILNKIEQWIHALHPKRPFDQCLERMEVLGMKKKSIKTQIKKIRMGLMPTVVDETPVEPMFEDEYEHLFPRVENETEETPWRRRTLSSSDEELPRSPSPETLENERILRSMREDLESDAGIPTLEEQMEMEDITSQPDEVNMAVDSTLVLQTQANGPESPDIPTLEEQLGMEDDILASI